MTAVNTKSKPKTHSDEYTTVRVVDVAIPSDVGSQA
jgi:hypothetical protein